MHTYIHTFLTYIHTLHTYIYIHTYIHTKHYITLHQYIHTYMHTLRYVTLRYVTLHYITLHTYLYYPTPQILCFLGTKHGLLPLLPFGPPVFCSRGDAGHKGTGRPNFSAFGLVLKDPFLWNTWMF